MTGVLAQVFHVGWHRSASTQATDRPQPAPPGRLPVVQSQAGWRWRRAVWATVLAALFGGGFLGGGVALAAESGGGAGLDACKTAHAGCIAACDSLEPTDAGKAGCAARCAADRAVCEAGEGLGSLTEQTDRLKGFLRGLTEGPAGGEGGGEAPVTEAHCESAHDTCARACIARHGRDENALAGCGSRCMADLALCQAQARLEEMTPQLNQEVDRWGDFLRGFLDQRGGFALPEGPGPGEAPWPSDPPPSGRDDGRGGGRGDDSRPVDGVAI